MTLRINLKKKKSKYIKYKISPTIDLFDPLCCGMEIKGDYLYIKESIYPFNWIIPLDDIKSIILLKKKGITMLNKSMYSSKTCEWETPQDLFDKLNEKYEFNLDACANEKNYKCYLYYTIEDDGLKQSWFGTTWCNPPYGAEIYKWVKKAYEEWKRGVTVVMLLPARTDTRWFHEYIYPYCKIHFIKGRLKFNNSKQSAPFPSMICIFE